MKKFTTIDEYIHDYPEDIQAILERIRQTIKKVAPEAQEAVSYGLPTFKFFGNLVHFGAFKKHIGFYPAPSGIEAYKKELSQYTVTTGAIQFPLNKPIPLDLIAKITKYRLQENSEKQKKK